MIGRSYAPYPGIDGRAYGAKIERLLRLYPWQIQLAQMNLLDSHDTSRLVSIVGGDAASVRLATLLLFTFPGAPSIYYGDEIGLPGALPDHWVRRSFPWEHPERWDHDALDFHRLVIALRKAHPALRTGSYLPRSADEATCVFSRRLDGSELVVAVNVSDSPRTVELPLGEGSIETTALEVVFTVGGDVEIAGDSGRAMLGLPARGGAVIDISHSTQYA